MIKYLGAARCMVYRRHRCSSYASVLCTCTSRGACQHDASNYKIQRVCSTNATSATTVHMLRPMAAFWYDRRCTASACCGESTPLAERGAFDRRVLEVSARNSRQPRPGMRPARAGPDRARVGASSFGMLSARSNAPGRVWHQGVRLQTGPPLSLGSRSSHRLYSALRPQSSNFIVRPPPSVDCTRLVIAACSSLLPASSLSLASSLFLMLCLATLF